MTDPRIEAAARAICKEFMKNGKALGVARLCTQDAFFGLARVAIAAADAVVAGTPPDTITIPEVRNDRPIPGKEGADG
ncbi:hypothetical protein [Acetobacter okinawensis]|uniref:hypothetical protein n=1 Tax=Acetobacter okinawensis TaxID=1076594 RepID=UPI0039E89553